MVAETYKEGWSSMMSSVDGWQAYTTFNFCLDVVCRTCMCAVCPPSHGERSTLG